MNEIGLPIKCEQCHKDTYLLQDDLQVPVFVICQNCGHETSHVFCPDCEIGGNFIEDISLRPATWNCPECQNLYQLPSSFYQAPIYTTSESKQNLDILMFQEHLNIEFLHDGKAKCRKLVWMTFLGVSFISFLPFLAAVDNDVSLWPLGLMFLLGVGWSIFVCIQHKTMVWDNFENLSIAARKKRMYYDSYWWYLHRGSVLIILSMPLVWMVLILFSDIEARGSLDKFLILPLIFLISLFFVVVGAKTLSRSRKQYRKWQQFDEFA